MVRQCAISTAGRWRPHVAVSRNTLGGQAMSGQTRLLENRWDDVRAAKLDEPGKLLYRSNLLGADKRITNYGGGNTSAKVMETDPLTGEKVRVMWVKGSGGDVGTIKLDGF